MPKQHRRRFRTFWVFTDFDHKRVLCPSVYFTDDDLRNISYMVWQREQCPETDKIHIQGYVELRRARSLSWVQNNISITAHFEARRGTAKEASDYCKKEKSRIDGPWELGDMTRGMGSRSDLIDFRDAIKKGLTIREINEDFYQQLMKYPRYYQMVRNLYIPKYDSERKAPIVTLLIGPTGCGKTKAAYWRFRNVDFFRR